MSTVEQTVPRPQSQQVRKSDGTLSKPSSIHHTYQRPTVFSELHKAYGDMRLANYSKNHRESFKKAIVDNGFKLGDRFDKVLEDPEPRFNNIVKQIENFRNPTRLDWIKSSHEPSFPRYKKQEPVAIGVPQNEKLGVLNLYQKDTISKEELKQKLGEDDFKRIEHSLRNAEDGKFTKATHELTIDQNERHHFNSNPVRNNTQVFSNPRQAYFRKLKLTKNLKSTHWLLPTYRKDQKSSRTESRVS